MNVGVTTATLFIFFLFVVVAATGQERIIRGRVMDESHSPLVNVSIKVKHATILETTSDVRGTFALDLTHIASDTCVLVFSHVGKRTEERTIRAGLASTLPPVILKDHSLALDEINVSARVNAGSTNSSVIIDRDMIERYPSLSLNDLLNHLPNRTMTAPSVQRMQQVTLRSAFEGVTNNARNAQELNNAFGVSIIVDDMVLNNNATMQGRNPGTEGLGRTNIGVLDRYYNLNGNPTSTAGYSGETTFGGVDLRQIPTENIERIEVITGVPSVRYGDLTAGAIIVERQAGRTPAFMRLQVRDNATSYGFSDGLSLGDRLGDLNFNLNYVNSYADNRDKIKQYNRINGSAIWTARFGAANQWKHTLSATYGRHIDGVKRDPDDVRSTIVRYDNWNVSLSSRWSFRPKGGFIQRYGFNLGYGTGHQETYQEYHHNVGFVLYTDAITSGVVEGVYDTGQYTARDHVDGRPTTLSGRLEAYAPWTWGRSMHTLNIGTSLDYSVNRGKGRLSDPSKPNRDLSGNYTERYYDFSLVMPTWNAGAYVEDRMQLALWGRPLTGAVGIRWDLQNAHVSFSPRTNVNLALTDALSVGVAYGLSFKSPGLAHLYPGPVFNDIVLLNAYNGKVNESTSRIYVDRYQPESSHLTASRSQTMELSIGWQQGRHRLAANAYYRNNRDGITTTEQFTYADLPQYTATPVPGQKPIVTEVGRLNLELSHNVMQNILVSDDAGAELLYTSPRVSALATSFSVSGGLYRTYSFADRPSYEPLTNTGTGPDDIIRGIYSPRPAISYVSNGRIGTTTHLPGLRLVVQLTADFRLMNYSVKRSRDVTPVGYVTRVLAYHYFTAADRDGEAYRMLADFIDTKYNRENASSNFTSANFHMAVAKELGKRLRLSFNVFNFLDYQPRYYRSALAEVRTPNSKPSFGAEISYKF